MKNYYYLSQDNQVSGPLSLDSISSHIEAGLIPSDTKLSLGGENDWISVKQAKLEEEVIITEKSVSGARTTTDHLESSMAGFLQIIAFLNIIAGVLCGMASIFILADNGRYFAILIALSVSLIISSILFYAAAEALRFLAIIASKK